MQRQQGRPRSQLASVSKQCDGGYDRALLIERACQHWHPCNSKYPAQDYPRLLAASPSHVPCTFPFPSPCVSMALHAARPWTEKMPPPLYSPAFQGLPISRTCWHSRHGS
jgi:hypothetical protein